MRPLVLPTGELQASQPIPKQQPGCCSNAEQEMPLSLFLYQSPYLPARLVSHSSFASLSSINQDGVIKDSRKHRHSRRKEKIRKRQRSYLHKRPMNHLFSYFLEDNCLLLEFTWLSGIISGIF